MTTVTSRETHVEDVGARLRQWRPLVLAASLLLVITLVVTWLRPSQSEVSRAPDNPGAEGAMALAELLRAEGIEVARAGTLPQALEEVRDGATAVVASPGRLTTTQRESLAQAGGDIVVIGDLGDSLEGLTSARTDTSSSATSVLTAQCGEEDAVAAGSLAGSAASIDLSESPQATGCFPLAQDRFAYATEPLPSGGTLRLVADGSLVTNAHLPEAGHAALAVRAAGRHEHVTWIDDRTATSPGAWDSPALPPWLPLLTLDLVLVTVVLALVRGRRLGAVITEDLPVVVSSTETTLARGRLYRRAADRQRAAEALRAGTARRLGRTLQVPPEAGREHLLDALERLAGTDRRRAVVLLYGPVPPNDKALASLAIRLDHLESEVRST
ncbi:DUF4350 domain-containing protein [Actinomyces wuliandei]|uniref:DUF4350 domain-containing protein n=1 Tax=Actinomyces wuliandei TaxID=2057743 RepID=UPI000FD77A43|nr:DUF4350 domain-containing protein [Actinomyces wuliandei]